MNYLSKSVMVFLVVLMGMLTGCANYQFGDVSRLYCASTSQESREVIKDKMVISGISVGVDYCFVVGLVDALLDRGE